MNKMSNLLWGLVFIIVGVIFGLNALEITDINILFVRFFIITQFNIYFKCNFTMKNNKKTIQK